MMLGGRGAGKTRAGAEWVRGCIEAPPHKNPARRIAVAIHFIKLPPPSLS